MTASNQKLTIGKLAKTASVGIETIRFYERKGLLKQPSKSTGFRVYQPEDTQKIIFIKRAQEIGFTLKEIKELFSIQATSKSMCKNVKKSADVKILEVENKIKDLKKMLSSLKEISNCCAQGETTNHCSLSSCFSANC